MALPGNISIRRARPADLAALLALLRLLFDIEADFSFDEARQRQGLALMLENEQGVVLVAENSGKVIGMCTGQLLVSTAAGGPAVQVEDVVVLPAWRDRGVGRLLMRAIAGWAARRKAARLQLLADRNNRAALAFYHKIGWQMTDLICLRKMYQSTRGDKARREEL